MSEPSTVLLGAESERRMQHRSMLRVVALACLAGVCLIFPAVGANRLWAAALLLGVSPIPLALTRFVPPAHRMAALSYFDICATVTVISFIPEAWVAGLVIAGISPAASSGLLGRRTYIALEILGLGGLAGVALTSDVPGWEVPLAVAGVLVPLVASYVDVYIAHEVTATARLNDIAQSSSAVFCEVEADSGDFVSVSGQVEEVLGFAPADLPPDLLSILAEEDRHRWWQQVSDEAVHDFVFECRRATDDDTPVWLRLHVRRATRGGRRLLRGIVFDVTELAKSHEEIRRRAETDHLTGLPNRFVLTDALNERLDAGHRLALFTLDLDRFKDINDTLGHHAGDAYLQVIAGRLHATLGDTGIVARMGGDEFAAVVGLPSGMDQITTCAERLVAACEESVAIGGIEFAGSASCGIAIAPDHGSDEQELLRRADLAMYAAKRVGSRVRVFDFGIDESKISRLELSGQTEEALDLGQLQLWFQPQVELATGRVLGAEALLRWVHPDRGVLIPADFLDVVELSKHRKTMSQTVINQGVGFLTRMRELGHPLSVAVNISIYDFADPDFAAFLGDELASAAVPPSALTLEVTERELMDDRAGFLHARAAVEQTGVRLSIDDFGTGHSSLVRLHELPVNELKIDRSFVSQLTGDNTEAQIIVKSIIELGRSLGHNVVAEGIEDGCELSTLHQLGCQVGQGFLYSPALPEQSFVEWMETVPALPASVA